MLSLKAVYLRISFETSLEEVVEKVLKAFEGNSATEMVKIIYEGDEYFVRRNPVFGGLILSHTDNLD